MTRSTGNGDGPVRSDIGNGIANDDAPSGIEFEQALATLAAARLSGYGGDQRQRDFRAVFDGHSSPEQGGRVLAQIIHWGGFYAPVHVAGDPYVMHVRAGAQELCQRILAAVCRPPSAAATRTQSTER